MATPLTAQQAKVLQFVQEYSASSNGGSPTVREVMTHLGASSPRTAQLHLSSLCKMGYLQHSPRRSRAYRMADVPAAHAPLPAPPVGSANEPSRPRVPILGTVPAGFPFPAEEERLGDLELPIRVSAQAFAVWVRGDSMRDAHIIGGDLAIADPEVLPADRSVVVALISGEYTLKTLRQAADRWWLEPANEEYPPILPDTEGDRVIAPVVALFRPKIGKRPRAQPWL